MHDTFEEPPSSRSSRSTAVSEPSGAAATRPSQVVRGYLAVVLETGAAVAGRDVTPEALIERVERQWWICSTWTHLRVPLDQQPKAADSVALGRRSGAAAVVLGDAERAC